MCRAIIFITILLGALISQSHCSRIRHHSFHRRDSSASGKMNWPKFLLCAGLDLMSCPGGKLKAAYERMVDIDCLNCDKFFHCSGNRDAVSGCGGSREENRRIATKISNCREEAQSDGDAAGDQKANELGRSGGDCGKAYLCGVNCKYNPKDNTCVKENCS